MEEQRVEIQLWTVPSDGVAFQLMRGTQPASGAKVTLCTKGVVPITYNKTADTGGLAVFTAMDLRTPAGQPMTADMFKEMSWLFFAYLDGADYGMWKDNAKFEYGMSYSFPLKLYKEVPTFFIKIELRDTIGAELFSNVVAAIEKEALIWAGLEVVSITGQGTKTITIKFKLPWHQSPIVVEWTAIWFILKVMAVAGAIIAVLYMLRWTFGEVGAPVVAGLGLGVLFILGVLALAPRREGRVETRTAYRR